MLFFKQQKQLYKHMPNKAIAGITLHGFLKIWTSLQKHI